MSKEVPEFHQLSKKGAKRIQERIEEIENVYQKCLGNKTRLYITGSIPLHAVIAPQEKWRFKDMDTLIPNITNSIQLKDRIQRVKQACSDLNGKFRAIHYALREGGDIAMKDVLAKTVCQFDKGVIPRVTTVFTDTSLAKHLEGAKPPAVVAYAANARNEFIILDHRWLRALSERRLPPNFRLSSNAQLKYGPRGFINDKWLGNAEPPSAALMSNKESQDRLFATIEEAQWRNAVTAKVHYRAGAAWRDARLFQGGMIALTGLYFSAISTKFKIPVAFFSLGLGMAIAEMPSAKATAHQRAGAGHSALEREWALLQTKLKEGRVRYDWADARAINLQRRKSKLEATSPNAPTFWKQGVKAELAHKRFNADP